MPERVQERRRSKERTTEQAPEPTKAERAEALKAELDDLLDEIDGVLEANAEEFVSGYVQQGGQ